MVLAVCCLSVAVTGIDITIVNVALPSIGASLHATVSSLQWTVDAYTLVIACLLVLSGSLADRYDRKRVFQIGGSSSSCSRRSSPRRSRARDKDGDHCPSSGCSCSPPWPWPVCSPSSPGD
jgi:MFS family permease